MAWKDPEKQREAIRKHYYANRDYYLEKAKRQKEELREWVRNEKQKTPCKDCGVLYPSYVTDYDHIGEKKMNISLLINRGSAKQVKEEIKKCELVCANCHRIRTFKRGYRKNIV